MSIQFSSQLKALLDEYNRDVQAAVDKAVKRTARATRDQIKATAPQNTGQYAKSWTVKNGQSSLYGASATVYSKDRYYLDHLLEFGHAKRNGGRVAARPHLAAAEKFGQDLLVADIKEALEHG